MLVVMNNEHGKTKWLEEVGRQVERGRRNIIDSYYLPRYNTSYCACELTHGGL